MRVVAGTARSRRLVAPGGDETRPTSDRVREALFNALGSMGEIHGAEVLDLYSGSGALGIEALSRGAAKATFVDRSAAAVAAIHDNVATCGFVAGSTVVRSDVEAYLRGLPSPSPFTVAFLDPPYSFEDWHVVLALVPAPLVVIESDRAVELPEHFDVIREKRYGGTVVTIARSADPEIRPQSEVPS